jgi:hypothetical protein
VLPTCTVLPARDGDGRAVTCPGAVGKALPYQLIAGRWSASSVKSGQLPAGTQQVTRPQRGQRQTAAKKDCPWRS